MQKQKQEIENIEIALDDGDICINKSQLKFKTLNGLNKAEKEVYDKTGSLVYASLYSNDIYMHLLDDQSSMILIDCSVKLLVEGTISFSKLTIKDNEFHVFHDGKKSKTISLPTCGSECYTYEQAEAILMELSRELH